MGGSNGGGGGFGPFSPRKNNEEENGNFCLNLSFSTDLASVDSTVLEKVSVGEIHEVVAETKKGPVVVMVKGERLGTILHMKDVLLLTCIFEGTEYQAKIISIDGGRCQVLISAKR